MKIELTFLFFLQISNDMDATWISYAMKLDSKAVGYEEDEEKEDEKGTWWW